jgi:hypothetical protein
VNTNSVRMLLRSMQRPGFAGLKQAK